MHGTTRVPEPLGRLPRPRPFFLPLFLESLAVPGLRGSGTRAKISRIRPHPGANLVSSSTFIDSPSTRWYGLRQGPPKLFPTRPLGSSRPRLRPTVPSNRLAPRPAHPLRSLSPRHTGTRWPRPPRRAWYAPRSPRSPQWFGRDDPSSAARPPRLVRPIPFPREPPTRAPQSVEPAAPCAARGIRTVCSARARHGPSAPRSAPLRRWGPPRGSRPPPAAPHGARRPLALLARQPPGPAAAADPGPLGPSHGEPPRPFSRAFHGPAPRAPVFVRGPLFSGVSQVAPKGGPAGARVPPWNPSVVRAGLSPLLRVRAGAAGVGYGGGAGSNYC